MHFIIRDDNVQENLIKHLNEVRENGGMPFVEVSNKKEVRRNSQNSLMHVWFSEIAKQTGNGISYESGRCKMHYFLPRMRNSQDKQCIAQIEMLDFFFKAKKAEGGYAYAYEYFIEMLGDSHLESTRYLSVKLFAEALTNMQEGERRNGIILSSPAKYGWGI